MTEVLRSTRDLDHIEDSSGALWILAGQIALVAAIFFGFGASTEVGPRVELVLVLLPTAVMVVLAPPRRYRRLVLTLPVVAYLGWWLLSYLWTSNTGGFILESQRPLLFAAVMVTLVCYLPLPALTRGLLIGCYAVIAWTVLYTGMNPATATVNDDAVPGWRGGFIHKNGMAPFMLFAVLTIAMFEVRRLRRNAAIVVALFFVVMAQSTTSLLTGALLLSAAWVVRSLRAVPVAARGRIAAVMGMLGLLGAALAVIWLPSAVTVFGKDPTLTSRTDIWGGVISAIADRPVTGYGIGGVWIDQAASHTRAIQQSLGFVVFHSHNGYLEVALQLGLTGLLLFVALMLSTSRRALALLDDHPRVGTYTLLFITLMAILSLTEVMTFGMWLVFLCALSTLCARLRIDGAHHMSSG